LSARVLDLFSCIGCHALGMTRAGFDLAALCESNAWRRDHLSRKFPTTWIFDDVRTICAPSAEICFGGPPCQRTSNAAAIHGYRTGQSLFGPMLEAGIDAGCQWFVVEQPVGNEPWVAAVCADLAREDYHVGRVQFSARDCGAPYLRRRDYIIGCTSLSRLAVAVKSADASIRRAARAAADRGDWDPDSIPAYGVDTWRSERVDERRERIEALGDSNPPAMAEAIGYMLQEGLAA
jgi:site-specific DNA-cytosine methylase